MREIKKNLREVNHQDVDIFYMLLLPIVNDYLQQISIKS